MTTLPAINFFAPISAPPHAFDQTVQSQKVQPLAVPESLSPQQLMIYQWQQLERADSFTYIIMGLAVLIAIVIPILNMN